MFLGTFFTTGRIIFIIFFVTIFMASMIYSYRKDIKNHKRYYNGAGKKVIIYGGLIVIIFIAIRIIWGN